jgi:hypothetical protein
MFSPKKYVEELVTTLLADWADSFDKTSVNIGLWNGGDVQLGNVALKRRTFDVGHGARLSMELGTGINQQQL